MTKSARERIEMKPLVDTREGDWCDRNYKVWIDYTHIREIAQEIFLSQNPQDLFKVYLAEFPYSGPEKDAKSLADGTKEHMERELPKILNQIDRKLYKKIAFPINTGGHFGCVVIDLESNTVAIGEPYGNAESLKGYIQSIEEIFKKRGEAYQIIVSKQGIQPNDWDCGRLAAVLMNHWGSADNLKATVESNKLPPYLTSEKMRPIEQGPKYNSKQLWQTQHEFHYQHANDMNGYKAAFDKFFTDALAGTKFESSHNFNRARNAIFDSIKEVCPNIDCIDKETTVQEAFKNLLRKQTEAYLSTYDLRNILGEKYTQYDDDLTRYKIELRQFLAAHYQAKPKASEEILSTLKPQSAPGNDGSILREQPPGVNGSILREQPPGVDGSRLGAQAGTPPFARANFLVIPDEIIQNAFGREKAHEYTVNPQRANEDFKSVTREVNGVPTEVFKLYKDRVESDSEDHKVLAAMLKVYVAASFARLPNITCPPELVKAWTIACNEVFKDGKVVNVKINGNPVVDTRPVHERQQQQNAQRPPNPGAPPPRPGGH